VPALVQLFAAASPGGLAGAEAGIISSELLNLATQTGAAHLLERVLKTGFFEQLPPNGSAGAPPYRGVCGGEAPAEPGR